MSDKDLKYRFQADDSLFGEAISRTLRGIQGLGTGMDSMAAKAVSGFSVATASVAGFATLVTGSALAMGFKRIIDMQDQIGESAQRVGLTSEAYSELAYVFKLGGVQADDLGKAFVKLSGTLLDAQQGQKAQVDLFKRLRIDPAQIKDSEELLLALADRFSAMEDGAAKTALAVDVFGEKLGPKLVPMLNEGRDGIAKLREEAQRLGVSISTESSQRAQEFNDNLDKLSAAATGAATSITNELAPSLAKALNFFVEATREAGLFEGTLISIGALTAKGLGLDEKGQLESKLSGLQAEAQRLQNVMIGVNNVLAREPGNTGAQRHFDTLTKKLALLQQQALDTSAAIARVASGAGEAGAGRGFDKSQVIKGTGGFTPDPKAPTPSGSAGPKAKPGLVGPELPGADYFTAQLDAARVAYAKQNDMREMSKAEELTYWQEVLQNHAMTAAARLDISRRVAQAELAALREGQQQRTQLDQAVRDRAEANALASVDQAQQASRIAYDQQVITYADLLQAEQQHEEQRLQIRQAYLQARLASIDPERDPVQYQQLLMQIEQLEQQHTLRVGQIRAQASLGQQQQTNGLITTFETTLNTISGQIMNRTLTWRGAFNQVMGSMAQSGLRTMSTIATNWIKGLLQMQTQEKAMSLASIHANAMKAGAAAYQAVVGIPYVGPFLAPAAAAVAYAGTMAFASAEGGYDIPAGVNPMTQLHEREMVLPQEQADAVRNMAAGGGGGGGGLVIQAAPLAGGFFAVHQDEFVRFYDRLKRNRYI
jgi:hypothetical protein